jgi:hypothetical protein
LTQQSITNTEELNMKKIIINTCTLSSLLTCLVPSLAMAGSLEPAAAPSDPASAVYKTDDLYNRLQSGTTGAKRTGSFTEPSAGPADGVGKSLAEIMAVAPVADNTNGASQGEVKTGKTFWGLRTDGTWGAKTGTASPAPVPRSGQSSSYVYYDDGSYQKGVAIPNPRFTQNYNATVTDNLTGLIWLTHANCGGAMTWANAVTWSHSLASGSCSLSDGSVAGDWRLPNRRELLSLVNDQYAAPALSNTAGTGQFVVDNPFSYVQPSGSYWTSTTNANGTTQAWTVYMVDGGLYPGPKGNSYFVWAVRGGQ